MPSGVASAIIAACGWFVVVPFLSSIRGAGTVMVDRGGVERDGVTVLSWQRLPSQLVQQHADRMQMKRPHFHPVKPSEPVRPITATA